MQKTTEMIIFIIRNIPSGKVISFGRIASLAGMRNGARQVVRILHSKSRLENLPWHRVVNKQGRIGLSDPVSASLQKSLLEDEGIVFSEEGVIENQFFWQIITIDEINYY